MAKNKSKGSKGSGDIFKNGTERLQNQKDQMIGSPVSKKKKQEKQ